MQLPLQPTFNIRRNGVPITKASIKSTIHTGISFGDFPGIIHPYYEIAACEKANYRFYHDWQELTPKQKSVLVAKHITDILLENHKEDAVNREMERAKVRAKSKKSQ